MTRDDDPSEAYERADNEDNQLELLREGLLQLDARSRDIIRKDGWASKAVDEWVCNAIGTGIKPQSMHPKLAVKEKLQALLRKLVELPEAKKHAGTPRAKTRSTNSTSRSTNRIETARPTATKNAFATSRNR